MLCSASLTKNWGRLSDRETAPRWSRRRQFVLPMHRKSEANTMTSFRLANPRSDEGKQYFIKCNGLGNDFVVIDGRSTPFRKSADYIKWVCNRHVGIGGDQLLVFEAPASPEASIRLRIYNIDGQEAETCLNATRCAAWLIMEETGRDEAVIETLGGAIRANRAGDHKVSLNIGNAKWDWAEIPLAGSIESAGDQLDSGPLNSPIAVNIGNPHLVYFVQDLDGLDIVALADPVQKSSYLPEQANIGVAEVTGPDSIRLVVYERPGILTQACGSGACAAVLAARRAGLMSSDRVTVGTPGGQLEVEIFGGETFTLTGPVDITFDGYIASNVHR